LVEAVADTDVGALGTPAEVVTDDDDDDGIEVPLVFVAVTVNVYAVEAVNPLTVMGDDEPVPVNPPGELVTV
jgi:hypothetical protein